MIHDEELLFYNPTNQRVKKLLIDFNCMSTSSKFNLCLEVKESCSCIHICLLVSLKVFFLHKILSNMNNFQTGLFDMTLTGSPGKE